MCIRDRRGPPGGKVRTAPANRPDRKDCPRHRGLVSNIARTSVVEGGGALWRARRSISPREKRRPLGGVGHCARPLSPSSGRRPVRTNGRTRALSPGACRESHGLGRIKALAAQLDAHLGHIDANALRRTSVRPCSASRTSRDPSHRPVRRLEVCPHPAAVFVPGSIATDPLRPLVCSASCVERLSSPRPRCPGAQ